MDIEGSSLGKGNPIVDLEGSNLGDGSPITEVINSVKKHINTNDDNKTLDLECSILGRSILEPLGWPIL